MVSCKDKNIKNNVDSNASCISKVEYISNKMSTAPGIILLTIKNKESFIENKSKIKDVIFYSIKREDYPSFVYFNYEIDKEENLVIVINTNFFLGKIPEGYNISTDLDVIKLLKKNDVGFITDTDTIKLTYCN